MLFAPMFDDVAKHMKELMGRGCPTRSIITVEQLPDAIAKPREAIAADRAEYGEACGQKPTFVKVLRTGTRYHLALT